MCSTGKRDEMCLDSVNEEESLEMQFLAKKKALFFPFSAASVVGERVGEVKPLMDRVEFEPCQLCSSVRIAGDPLRDWVVHHLSGSESAAALIGN